jgi:hypothetical protein
MVNTSGGDVDEQPFTLRGTFSTGSPFYDTSVLFLPLPKAQAITHSCRHRNDILECPGELHTNPVKTCINPKVIDFVSIIVVVNYEIHSSN